MENQTEINLLKQQTKMKLVYSFVHWQKLIQFYYIVQQMKFIAHFY